MDRREYLFWIRGSITFTLGVHVTHGRHCSVPRFGAGRPTGQWASCTSCTCGPGCQGLSVQSPMAVRWVTRVVTASESAGRFCPRTRLGTIVRRAPTTGASAQPAAGTAARRPRDRREQADRTSSEVFSVRRKRAVAVVKRKVLDATYDFHSLGPSASPFFVCVVKSALPSRSMFG
jgi:hypothetical protein